MTTWFAGAVAALCLVLAGCSSTEPGEPVMAGYTAPAADTVTATSLGAPKTARIAAISPDGRTAAVVGSGRFCLVPTRSADQPASGRCLTEPGIGYPSNLVSFSGDGSTVMVMPNIALLASTPLYLVSTSTAKARAVMPPASSATETATATATTSAAGTTSSPRTTSRSTSTPARAASLWWYGIWSDATGRLIALSQPGSNTEAIQVSEVDPVTGKVTVLGPAADPKTFPAAAPVLSGSMLLFALAPTSGGRRTDLVVFDPATHRRRVLADVKPVGTGTTPVFVVPLAISPDGKKALVGVRGRTGAIDRPAQVVDLTTGVCTALPGDSYPQAGAYSPDGRLFALLLEKGRGSALTVTATNPTGIGAKGTDDMINKVVATVADTRSNGLASMRWSSANVLSVTSLGATLGGDLAGWTLR